jgi:phospholipid/cholesterol/gamma-HCH transport system permease protein
VADAVPNASETPEKPSKLREGARDAADWLVKVLLSPFVELGALSKLLFEAVFWGIRPPYRGRLFVEAMEFIGIGSIFIVSLTAVFVGGVLALQLVDGFRDFGAENQTGAVIGLALAREVGPVFAALMVTSRAGSAMTTELGSMRVTNQIDALVTMAVEPVQYLVVPRIVAGLVMVPVLTMLFDVVGVFGAFFVAVSLLGLDPGVFMDRLRWLVDWDDVSQGLIKAMVFGVAVTLIACRQGFYAEGGAAGVGRATNRAVVHSAIAILMLDYLVTSLVLGQGFF